MIRPIVRSTRISRFPRIGIPTYLVARIAPIRRIHLKDYYEPKDPIQGNLIALKTPKPTPKILNPVNNVSEIIDTQTYEAQNIEEAVKENESQPIVGSLVYYGRLGLVLKESNSRFDGSSVIVLNDMNEIETVRVSQLIQHFHGVVDAEWVNNLKLLSSFPEDYSRGLMVDLLREFYLRSESFQVQVGPSIDILYAQGHHIIHPIKVIKDISCSNHFDQSCALMSIYLHVHSKPEKFMIMKLEAYSSLFPPVRRYISIKESVSDLVREYLANPISSDVMVEGEPHGFFSIVHPEYRGLLETMKLSIIHPHPVLLEALNSNKSQILRKLKHWGVYTDDTDIYASCLFDPMVENKTSVQSAKEVKPKITVSTELHDYFRYLRKECFDTIYAFNVNNTTIGISLNKRNSRNFTINLHIPDVSTKLSPDSDEFNSLINKTENMRSITTKGTNPIFDSKFTESLNFQGRMKDKQLDRLSDLFNSNDSFNPDTTCLTISVPYNTFESNPFVKYDKDEAVDTKIQLSSISSEKIKFLDEAFLGKAINGKSSTLPIHVFKSAHKDELDNDTYYTLGFMYEYLLTHSKHRNVNGASNYQNILPHEARTPKGKVDFFLRELQLFASNVTNKYAFDNGIPLVKRVQTLSSSTFDPANDDALVYHNNKLLPYYHATSYFQSLLSRDENGNVSLSAKVIGNKYLKRPYFTSTNVHDFPSGLKLGYSEILEVFDSTWSILNQFQLLSFLHLDYVNHKSMRLNSNFKNKFGFLKRKGYNVNGPLREHVLQKYIQPMDDSTAIAEWIESNCHKYETLKVWEKTLESEETLNLHCVVTDIGEDFDRGKLVTVEVENWDVKVEMVTWTNIQVGQVLKSHEVILLNPIEGLCILKESFL
ncbi:hypothetical protein CLIB1444_02S07976 [[Candida] jaroonii]|uniref:Uncharacterized protein n=1 Tax=[Candida] jaroonii TaxID=467808 RepID=A0ACA9Y381_9ASCO|nr:hypothetical protein CLIB1444_02S07976 [[Candida] jaroonii]